MKKRQTGFERALEKLSELSVPHTVTVENKVISIEGNNIRVLFIPSKNTFTTNTGKQGRSLRKAITVAGYDYNLRK